MKNSAFKKIDTNNSGFLSPDELRAFFDANDGPVDQVDQLIAGADFNGDGKINYNEFVSMVVKKQI